VPNTHEVGMDGPKTIEAGSTRSRADLDCGAGAFDLKPGTESQNAGYNRCSGTHTRAGGRRVVRGFQDQPDLWAPGLAKAQKINFQTAAISSIEQTVATDGMIRSSMARCPTADLTDSRAHSGLVNRSASHLPDENSIERIPCQRLDFSKYSKIHFFSGIGTI